MGTHHRPKSKVVLFYFVENHLQKEKGKSLVLYNKNIQNGERTIFLLPYNIQSFWKIDANRICIASRFFRSCFSGFESFKRVVLATEKKTKSILYEEHSTHKIEMITDSIGAVYSGMGPDYRQLIRRARKMAHQYKLVYGE